MNRLMLLFSRLYALITFIIELFTINLINCYHENFLPNSNFSIRGNMIVSAEFAVNTMNIYIVSIIDSTSILSCLLKLHSIILSCSRPKQLVFKFLIIDNDSHNLSQLIWNTEVESCFGNSIKSFETKLWSKYSGNYEVFKLNTLRNSFFDKDVIFARFFLTDIFSDIDDRLIYLDNDIFVTADIYDLYTNPMYVTNVIEPVTVIKSLIAHTKDLSNINHHNLVQPVSMQNYLRHNKHPKQSNIDKNIGRKLLNIQQKRKKTAPIAFVFESHPYYASYINAHFNLSNQLVLKTTTALTKKAFLNGGVFLLDCKSWSELL